MTTAPTILIIDDCAPIAEIIASHLKKAGYATRIARGATDAQRILASTTPDCILLDLMMPDISGAELLHAIRSESRTADVPVILVSARVGHGTHFRSQMDANHAVGKPFTRQQIVEAVRAVLKKHRPDLGLPARPAPPAPRVDARARIAAELGLSGFSAR